MQDPTCPSDGTWQQLGPVGQYDLSVRGGFGDVTYYMSGNYNDTKGTLPTSAPVTAGSGATSGSRPSRG